MTRTADIFSKHRNLSILWIEQTHSYQNVIFKICNETGNGLGGDSNKLELWQKMVAEKIKGPWGIFPENLVSSNFEEPPAKNKPYYDFYEFHGYGKDPGSCNLRRSDALNEMRYNGWDNKLKFRINIR